MLVIIHGWSDTHTSFNRLGRRLVEEGLVTGVAHVRLGDYVSLDDDVTFDDLTQALHTAWKKEGLPIGARTVDVVVHSTGGLVVRHWMTTHFTPATNPVRRLLMLAPANFGSPLAHKGRSFIGRIVKGFKSDRRFHTGTHILKGLEMASPFSWGLAERDRFGKETWYGPGRVLCTVLVGTAGYTGISSAANQDGGDGTVLVSTAHLNPAKVSLDFSVDPQVPTMAVTEANGVTAFARVARDNHSTLAFKEGGPKNQDVVTWIRRALTVTDAQFPHLVADLDAVSQRERDAGAAEAFTQAYQNTVVRLRDNFDAHVHDYFVEVYANLGGGHGAGRVDQALTRVVQEQVFSKVHAYGDNAAYRSLLFNTTALARHVTQPGHPLFISVTATPDIRRTGTVGYSTFGFEDIGSIRLTSARQQQLFQPDRTVLVDLVIRREQTEKVFRLMPLPE